MVRLLLLALAASPWLAAQTANAPSARGFLTETIQVGDTDYPYVLYVPRDYQPAVRWPLIVFLHGAGECGTDGQLQLAAGLPPAIVKRAAEWPFLVLIPQKPNRGSAWEDHDEFVLAMLQRTQRDYAVDARQLFLTGLSQGGHGTWVLGARHKDLWAAIAPVCGYGDPSAIGEDLAAMPLWAFHGDADNAVPVQQSRSLVAAVQQAGGKPELTVYPGVGHNSWDKAYGDELLADWLLSAAAERIVRGFLDAPASLTTARIRLSDAWFEPNSTGPSVGDTTSQLELHTTDVAWSECTTYRAAPDVPNPAPRGGSRTGRDLLLQHLRALLQGGALRLPRQLPEPAGMSGAFHRFTLDIELDGAGGPFVFHRALPKRLDAQNRERVQSLRDFQASVAALK